MAFRRDCTTPGDARGVLLFGHGGVHSKDGYSIAFINEHTG
jgi:hypothetical protein